MIRLIYSNDDNNLVKACVKGNRSAQEQFYAKFAPKMHALCRGYSKDEDTANELLQEGFIKVFKNLKQYKSDGSLEGWIRRTMINNAVDHFRRSQKFRYTQEINDFCYEENGDMAATNDVWKSLDAQDYQRITKHLPDGYRMIMNLYVVEGYTHKEIGEELGITTGTSKSQFAKAKKYLRKTIDQYVDKEFLVKYEEQFSG